ncbi:transcription factor E2F4 isoform X1 [Egretta garzetta]|uniref:transcription factor E2F4 isoform X1 n=1 Tax=Egretta garzetta TaxID=188379 RepID=UPI00163C5306|nr:transcription factor E2F4 isoform X1 [Egretta garzetta]
MKHKLLQDLSPRRRSSLTQTMPWDYADTIKKEMLVVYECMNSELLEELMSSEVFAPLLRLSPPPGDHDYIYNLDESEGVCDLFDVPVLNL